MINSADPLSEAIGRYYQRARHIQADQVIRVRFAPGRTSMPVAEFRRIRRQVERQTPERVQAYALAWAAPWRVGCQSITSAFSFGYRPEVCGGRCGTAHLSPYFARGDVRRPWDQLRLRPSMLLAATSVAAGQALIDRGVAADGTRPPGTAYMLSTSDPIRNVRAAGFSGVASALSGRLRVVRLWGDSLEAAPDVIAYFTGLTVVRGIQSNHYRPGAVADHLTSSGGMLTGPSGRSGDGGDGQMSALGWLEAGATGSYGTVVEPCNLPAKFPDPGLLLSYYRRGDTLIESYWRSVAMPDQGVFIGEPLARPWIHKR
ncbi:MAG: TIGR03790 family protein [Synechococcaceae cyanobacterium ELA739]